MIQAQHVGRPLCSALFPSSRHIFRPLFCPSDIRHASGTFRRPPRMRRQTNLAGRVPTDLGLLEGTFVMPQTPTFFQSPRKRIKLYAHRMSKFYENARMMLTYRYGIGVSPRPAFKLSSLKKETLTLHKNMYTAFASGDLKTLKSICCEGLLHDFEARIATRTNRQRQRNATSPSLSPASINDQKKNNPTEEKWTLHKYIGRPRIVSSRAVVLPVVEQSALRQHVVRVKSVQSVDGGEPMEMVEYLVLQQRLLEGKSERWMVWGTVEETDAESVLGKVNGKGDVADTAAAAAAAKVTS